MTDVVCDEDVWTGQMWWASASGGGEDGRVRGGECRRNGGGGRRGRQGGLGRHRPQGGGGKAQTAGRSEEGTDPKTGSDGKP